MTHHRTTGSAGSGSPGPAEPSAASSEPVDVVAPEARVELERIRRRWAELPVARASDAAPQVSAVVAELAARTAGDTVGPPADLGPATLVDQLAVLVWDAYALGCAGDIPEKLAALRRVLP
ncbi:MAG: hypothetical protein ACRCYR_18295 [Phycicoccus sp.]